MDDVARAAGVSRQTVYAHFPSRDALLTTLIDQATDRVLAAIDAADLDTGPADQALGRFIQVGLEAFGSDPFLLHLAGPPDTPAQDRDRHAPVLTRLAALVERGQRTGDIDPALPINWILAAILALGHAAGEEVRAGRMTPADAIAVLGRSVPRLVRPDHRAPTAGAPGLSTTAGSP